MDAPKFNRLLQKIKYDKQAIAEIYNEYYPAILMHLQRKFGKLISVEDVAHEVFVTLMAMDRFNQVDYPTAWMYKIAEHKAINRIKLNHNDLELSEDYSAPFRLDDLILKQDTKNALKHLDERSQMILYLNIWEGYTFAEIAEQLNLQQSNVRVIASRAYKKLRKYM